MTNEERVLACGVSALLLVSVVMLFVHRDAQQTIVTSSYVTKYEYPTETMQELTFDTCDIPELSDCVNDEDWEKECAND